jgi:DNA-binding CsgD family transcriptional regulator
MKNWPDVQKARIDIRIPEMSPSDQSGLIARSRNARVIHQIPTTRNRNPSESASAANVPCGSTQQNAVDLIGDGPDGVGYLFKERVGDVGTFVKAASRVAEGGSALDSELVARMLGRRSRDSPIDQLSPREREVMAAMAEGKTNGGIAEELVIGQPAVEKHVTSIFRKLGLDPAETGHRRELAVLMYLRKG